MNIVRIHKSAVSEGRGNVRRDRDVRSVQECQFRKEANLSANRSRHRLFGSQIATDQCQIIDFFSWLLVFQIPHRDTTSGPMHAAGLVHPPDALNRGHSSALQPVHTTGVARERNEKIEKKVMHKERNSRFTNLWQYRTPSMRCIERCGAVRSPLRGAK